MWSRPVTLSRALVVAAAGSVLASAAMVAQSAGTAQSPPKPAPCSSPGQAAGQGAGQGVGQDASKCAPAASPAQQFPYPGDQPGTTADPDDPIAAGSSGSSSSAPAPTTGSTPPDAPAGAGRKSFPYPGEPDPAAASGAPGTSSSSSSSSSSAADPDDPLDTPDAATKLTPGRRKLPKVKKLQSDEDREAEDVKVAKFYRDDGNNLAAYNRLRDATKLVTDDADAWFLLGEIAEKLHKPDEAHDAYRKFLALEPQTGRAKRLVKDQPQLSAQK